MSEQSALNSFAARRAVSVGQNHRFGAIVARKMPAGLLFM